MNRSRSRSICAAALAAAASLVLAACSSSGSTASTAAPTGPVTLKVNDWGDFGLKALIPQYEKDHPNVHIIENSGDYNQQHQNLQKFLVAGSGAPDISAIDEGFMVQFKNQADKFVDMKSLGGGSYESKYLPWKWAEAQAPGGQVIGLGTDVGGLAMCYRADLFKAAGLPSDRDAVSALWPTWADFINVGKQYVAGSGGKKFVDSATNIMNPVLAQQPVGYIDKNEQLAMDGGPKVAWGVSTDVLAAGLSANLNSFTPEWNAAFKTGKFATLACPAWMQGYIQGQAPATSGKWDIAQIPGGGGNWGGSFWTIPKQGKNIAAAYQFIQWLVQPAQQLAIFKSVGNMPSQPALWTDPAMVDFKNPFFSNAPVGQIFTKTAEGLNPQYLGKKSGAVRVAVENDLTLVQQGKIGADAGWAKAQVDAAKAMNS